MDGDIFVQIKKKNEENFDKWLYYYALFMRLEKKNELESDRSRLNGRLLA